jgi:hypothetical protein
MIAIVIIQLLVWSAMLAALIYLIVRRVNLKKEETFDDRDN